MAVTRNGSGSGTSTSAATVTPRATSSFAETGLPTTSSARDAIPGPPGLTERFRDMLRENPSGSPEEQVRDRMPLGRPLSLYAVVFHLDDAAPKTEAIA